ncbi:MAG: cytochrome P450 [Pseudonocardiaceae bacterium]|nr:cytochrome P450 [Pseudonocardiaceae bacterium]
MTDLFAHRKSRLGDPRPPANPSPVHAVVSPHGGTVWVINDAELAAQAFADPRITKDPAFAPVDWPRWGLGLEPPGTEQPSLTTLDGDAHRELRQAHAPLFTAKRLQARQGRIEEVARELLAGAGADLAADFTIRYPLTVICELLGVPVDHLDEIAAACRDLATGGPDDVSAGVVTMMRLAGTAAAPELRWRLSNHTHEQVDYLLFGLVLAGQVTTEATLGFVIAHLLAGHQDGTDDAFVREILRTYPPAPYSLWRFTTAEVWLDGHPLPPRSPLLIHIDGLNAQGHDLTFGAGAHYCLGAQLAQLELTTVVRVIKRDYPRARLTVPFAELPVAELGIQGARLVELPVRLC